MKITHVSTSLREQKSIWPFILKFCLLSYIIQV
uniref:Uncharacterized protein n=1 Tax=Rhizophora mucronata TaxID=61149 RepID=A0A2P2NVQ0_RHIMU